MASSYPGGLDSFPTNRTNATTTEDTHPADHNNANDAINKIEAELGVNPSSSYATVNERLAALAAEVAANTSSISSLSSLGTHASRHVSTGADPLTGLLDATARSVYQREGSTVGTRRAVSFVAGTGISLSALDDPANERVVFTITATGTTGGTTDPPPATLPPGVQSVTATGSTVTVNFTAGLLADAVPATTDFAVAVNGTPRTVNSVAVAGSTCTLTLASAVTAGQTVSVVYTNPAQVIPPEAPGDNYTIPGGATSVTDGTTLQSALNGGTAIDIVLEPGTYDKASAFTMGAAHRLFSRNQGQAVLTAGIEAGSNSTRNGQRFSGLRFEVTDPAKDSANGACLGFWGASVSNMIIEDCQFYGGTQTDRVIQYGIWGGACTGMILRRCEAHYFTDVGFRISDNNKSSTQVIDTISDIYSTYIARATPGAADGQAESGLWVGHPVTNHVRRVKVRKTGWMGLTPVNDCDNTTFFDVDIDEIDMGAARTAVYAERNCDNIALERFILGNQTATTLTVGINGEWDANVDGNAALNGFVARHGRIVTAAGSTEKTRGLYADDGSRDIACHDVVFAGMRWTCAGWNNDTAGLTSASDFHHNDYSQRVSGCARVSDAQLNSYANGFVPDIATETTLPRRLLSAATTRDDIATFNLELAAT